MVILRGKIAFQKKLVLFIACTCILIMGKLTPANKRLIINLKYTGMSYQKGCSSPVHKYDTTTRYATQIALYAQNVCENLNMTLRDTRNALD